MLRTAIIPFLALFAFASAQGPTAATGKLVVAQKTVAKGAAVKATLVLEVPAGHHAYAPVKENEEYIVVSIAPVTGAAYQVKPTYPKGVNKKYPGMDHAVLAYEGTVKIPVQFVVPANAKAGKLTVKAVVTSQVCSNQTGICYPPKKQMVTGTVTVR
jgi:DsbC/DsbD-like thiol-disulfide interchange protein